MRRTVQASLAAAAGLVLAGPGAAAELRPFAADGTLERLHAPSPFGAGALAVPFNDPAGDQAGDLMTGDITLTDVTDSPTHVTFNVDILNAPTLRANDVYELLLDTDRNPATGDPAGLGAEILIVIDGSFPGYAIGRWNGAASAYEVIQDTAQIGWGSGPLIAVSRAELGITNPGFNFVSDSLWVVGTAPPQVTGADLAPDAGTWSYTLATMPPAPPPPPDTTAPNTTIVAGVSGRTARRSATFRFRSNEAGGTFQCKLDRGRWTACRSPKTYRNLKAGRHTFLVRARDKAGNVDRTPARRSWTVRR